MRVIDTDTGGGIFAHTDYRVVLREVYVRRKRLKRVFSYGVWARELGISSPSTLIMILNGQRHPGDELVRKLVRNLGLSSTEGDYFSDLVDLQKTQGKDTRNSLELIERIARSRKTRDLEFVDYDTFQSIALWYYAALRQMVRMAEFKEDPFWICEKLAFKVTPKEIRHAISTLLNLGLLRRDARGKLHSTSTDASAGQDTTSAAVRKYHEGTLDNAKAALTKFSVAEREFVSTTFLMPAAKIAAVKEALRDLQETICDRFEDGKGDRLFQFQMAFYPVTR